MRHCIRGVQQCNVWTPAWPPLSVQISPEARSHSSSRRQRRNPVAQDCSNISLSKMTGSATCCTAVAEGTSHSHPCGLTTLHNDNQDVSSSDDDSQTSYIQQGDDFDGIVMTSEDLRSYISQHTELAGVMLVQDLDKSSTDPDVIKSLIIYVDGKPAVAILRGADRMDHKKVASAMGVSRQRVRLATRLEAVTACGFVPGTVPPFGHRQQLPTLVDVRLLGLQGLVYAGGGDHNVETAMDVATLVAHTEAQVVDIAVGPNMEFPTPINSSEVAPTHGGVPLPWQPGAKVVQLVGVVALRRRVAKLLQFCTLVPESTPSLPEDGKAMHLRRVWANPDAVAAQPSNGASEKSDGSLADSHNQSPTPQPLALCEVQLIMGKTLERNVGREEAIRIMDRIKPGTIIKVTGRTQPHGPPPDYVPTANARNSSARLPHAQQQDSTLLNQVNSAASIVQGDDQRSHEADDENLVQHEDPRNQPPSRQFNRKQGRPSVVLDVVCHHVEVLYKTRDRLEKDLARARRTGRGNPFTACELLQERQLALANQKRPSIQPLTSTVPSSTPSQQLAVEAEVEEVLIQKSQSVSDPCNDLPMQPPDAPVDQTSQFWQMDLDQQDIVWVDNVQGLDILHQCIAQPVERYKGALVEDLPGSPLLAALPPPVGLDCEWAPYERNEVATPVALLQVAIRDRVFLVDLLTLLQSNSQQTSLPTQDQQSSALEKQKLGELLQYVLLNPDVTALGFQFMQDMSRLVSTYPWLLPFLDPTAVPSQPDVPAATSCDVENTALHRARQSLQSALGNTGVNGIQYVDVLRLARATNPEDFLYRFGQPHTMSLSKVVQEVFGMPLDKTCQRSNWAQRPLSYAQRTYAAADAFSLVALHDLLLSGKPSKK